MTIVAFLIIIYIYLLQARSVLDPRSRYPAILVEGRAILTDEDHNFLRVVGFDKGPYLERIEWEYPLLLALMERWDSSTSTFWLSTGPMTITAEDLHR